MRGTPKAPVWDEAPLVITQYTALEEQFGQVRVTFNRGLLSTQALNRGSDAPAKNAKRLREAIGMPGNQVRLRLAKELLPALKDLLRRAREDGGTCYAALYELTDEKLLRDVEATRGTEIVLSNANSSKKVAGRQTTICDGTNAKSRDRLRADDDRWQDKYFDSGFLASRDRFVLP